MRNRQGFVRAVGAAGLGLLLFGCGAFDPGSASTPTVSVASSSTATTSQPGNTGSLADAVAGEVLTERLRELERITMAVDGNRSPGSQGFEAAARYIEDELAATGFYDVRREDFTIQVPHPGQSELATEDRVVNQIPLSFSPGTPAEGISGRLVEPAAGDGCSASDWDESVAGQFALVARGGCSFEQMNQVAAQAGASMVVVTNNREGGLYGTLNGMRPEFVPMTGVTRSEGDRLRAGLMSGERQFRFSFEQRIESWDTFNLVAETRSGDAGNVLMAGAHLDSVVEGPGMNDNGSGSVVLLETAVQLAARPSPPRNKVRLVWWGGEEWGLLGSLHWVNSRVTDEPQAIERLAAYVNVDMIASPNYVVGVYDGDGSDFPNEALPAGSADIEAIYTSWFDSIGQPWVPVEVGSSSDHAAFMPSGVPVGGLFTGAGDAKSSDEQAVFGGQAGQPYDPNYHSTADTFDNVNLVALEVNGKASAHVIGRLADDTSMISDGPREPSPAQGFGYAGTV